MAGATLVMIELAVAISILIASNAAAIDQRSDFAQTKTTNSSRPNFVILFLDDHGWGDFGANVGSNIVTETPNLDALASSGVRFTDMHAGFSVCTASRAALLTGRLAPRTGVADNFGPTSNRGMALQEQTIANYLVNNGYDTHMIGKWHLGHNVNFSVTYRGFQVNKSMRRLARAISLHHRCVVHYAVDLVRLAIFRGYGLFGFYASRLQVKLQPQRDATGMPCVLPTGHWNRIPA